jgi:hypothetical protein
MRHPNASRKPLAGEPRDPPGEPIAVECTHCRVALSEHSGNDSRIRYFRCPSCRRWFSSMYAEIFRADAKVRFVGGRAGDHEDDDFAAVKKRLEAWLAQLDSQDPYRVLGMSPNDSVESIKTRYRQLALERHPDRGGSVEGMKELNLAYGRIASRAAQRRPDCEADDSTSSARPVRDR